MKGTAHVYWLNKYDHLPWAIFDLLIFIPKDSCTFHSQQKLNKYDHLPWAIFDMLIFILKDSCTLKHIDMRENDVKIWNLLHCESMIYEVWRSVILSIQNLCDVGWLFAIVNHFRGLAWMCAPYLFVFVLGFQTWFVLLSSSMAPSSRPGRGSWKHGSSWQHPLRLRI